MRTRILGIMAFMFLIVGSLFIAANPASAEGPVECEPESAPASAIVGDNDDRINSCNQDDGGQDEEPRGVPICHLVDGEPYDWWQVTDVAKRDLDTWMNKYPADFVIDDTRCGNKEVSICQLQGIDWVRFNVAPYEANDLNTQAGWSLPEKDGDCLKRVWKSPALTDI